MYKGRDELPIAEIHLGDVESSNILCEEIARRFNEFENWHECKDDTEAMPEIGTNCILRVEYQNLDDGEWYTDYLTSTWGGIWLGRGLFGTNNRHCQRI